MNSLSPQNHDTAINFLLLCLRGRFDPEALTAAHRLAEREALDWAEVRRLLRQESLAPLIFSIVRGQDLVPPTLEQQLQRTYLYNAMRNTLLLAELSQVLQRMAEIDVPIIVLKGAALAEVIYGDIAVRPMSDIDLLVRAKHIAHSLRVLTAFGYTMMEPEERPGKATTYENEVLLRKSGPDDMLLEVHWSLLDSPHYQHKLQMDWFWQTATPARFGGAQGLALGPETQLLHLCSHLMLHHHGEGLLWLHDVAEVLHHHQAELDWEQVLDRAQAFDLVLPLQTILPQVAEQWCAPVPDDVLQALKALQPSLSENKVFAWLTAVEQPVGQRFYADLASMSDWRQRFQYAWWNLFPSPDYMRHRYNIQPPVLLPLFYFYRWFLGARSMLFHPSIRNNPP